jgi:triosephosphate isomerase
MRQPEIDGGLVGGASLKPDDFITLIRATAQEKRLS